MFESVYKKDMHLLPDQPVVCIHHLDADGMLSADILKLYFNQVFFIGVNYGRPVNYNSIPYNSIIFIVDFTIPVEAMQLLSKHSKIIWIDHHVTAWDPEYAEFKELEGIRSTECAACKLVWKYIFPDAPVPRAIQLSSDYDTWVFTDPNTLSLHYAIEMFSLMPRQISDVMLRKIVYNDEFINTLIVMGKRIVDYVNARNKLISNDGAFITEINGHKVIAINIRNTNSMVLDDMARQHPEIQLRSTFGYNAGIGKYKCSLYSDNEALTCQEIDARFKGHPTAAGMECTLEELPYKLPTHDLKEPDMFDLVSEIERMNKEDPLVYRHDGSAVGGLCRSQGYPTTFEGLHAWVVNHPYWSGSSMYNTNLITDYEVAVFWNFTKTGWYRYRIYPLEKNRMSLQELVNRIPNSKIVGNAIWCYRNKPLESDVPIVPQEETPRQFFGKNNYNTPYYNGNRRW